MKNIDVMGLSMRQIEMFLAVARFSSITMAADYLHVTKSAVSKCIQQIERELDLILFLRLNSGLRLTPAGKVLEEGFSQVSSLIENAVVKAQSKQFEQTCPLMVGVPAFGEHAYHIKPFLDSLKAEDSSFDYYIEYYTFKELPEKLLANDVDIIFTTLYEETTMIDLSLEYLVAERFPLTVAMRPDNPLATRKELDIDEILGQRFVVLSPVATPNYMRNVILPLFANSKGQPRIAYYAASPESIAINIRDTDEVAIIDDCYMMDTGRDLVSPVLRNSHSGMIMAWLPENDSPTAKIIEALRESFQARENAASVYYQ